MQQQCMGYEDVRCDMAAQTQQGFETDSNERGRAIACRTLDFRRLQEIG